ncbi:hypothetical protein C1645_737129 [Glomus cerebriforme]|uniref:Uncharacterized protein n=1 Tax=Glomus cerebriforme TaxID=658196 RepID=A0A397T8K0_9GLOM|nr:hypothetical protein C1645_737129 [Glomus cerebriforme]
MIYDNKSLVTSLYFMCKLLYRDHEKKILSIGGGSNIISFFIKRNRVNSAISLLKYIDQKDKLMLDILHIFHEFLKDDNYDNKIERIRKGILIKQFLQGILSAGIIPNEEICQKIFKRNWNDKNEKLLIDIYNILKKNEIKLSNDIYQILFLKENNDINKLTIFYKDMISIYAKEELELDMSGFASLELMEKSFKEGKFEIAIKYFNEIRSKQIKSNPIILFELFKGLFESKMDNYKILLIYKLIIQEDIKINSDIEYFLILGFLCNDELYYAEQMLQEITKSKIVPPAYIFVSLIQKYFNKGMIDKVEGFMRLIKPIYIEEYSHFLRRLLSYFNKKQDKDGILRWVNELENDDEKHEAYKCTILMYSYGILGKLSDVIKNWEKMNEKYSGDHLSAAISILFDQIGHYGDVITLKKYWKIISNNSNTKYILSLNHYNSYIEALCRFKAFDDAIKIFKFDLALNGFDPTLKTVVTLLQPLVSHNFVEKENVLSFIKLKWPNLYNDLIQCIIKSPERFSKKTL